MPISDSEKRIVSLIVNPQFSKSELEIWTSYNIFDPFGQYVVLQVVNHQISEKNSEIWKFGEVRVLY